MSPQKCHENSCFGCLLSQGKWSDSNKKLPPPPPGGIIIKLPGNWILNHYGGSEGFLGWLALQPNCHRMKFIDLKKEELEALGINIKSIDEALQKYWNSNFPGDPIQRVYIIYFFESVFDSKSTKCHLHIHLIPRTKAMDLLLREEVKDGETSIVAWNIYKLGKKKRRELDSLGYSRYNEEAVKKLMKSLKEELEGR